MAATDFWIKKGDRRPYLDAQCVDEDNNAVDLTAATSVQFNMFDKVGTVKISLQAATIEDAVTGMVRYAWGATDTDTQGDFGGEFQVTWNDGTKSTFPNHKYIRIKIRGDIA
jgi:hypothetical protein